MFLMKDGTVRIGDFGNAKQLEYPSSVAKTRVGTPHYLAPEVTHGEFY